MTWRGEVVGITVRGESDDLGPSSVGALTLTLLVAWAGAGLVLWSALGDGRFRGFPGRWMRTFAWMFLGLWTLAPAGYIVASGVGWGTAVAAGFWLFGLAVIVPFFSDGRGGLRWSVGTRWRRWRGVTARRSCNSAPDQGNWSGAVGVCGPWASGGVSSFRDRASWLGP